MTAGPGTFMGVDPGVNGAIAVLSTGRPPATFKFAPGMTDAEFKEVLIGAVSALRGNGVHDSLNQIVFIERVGYMPGDGGKGAFTFGNIFGMIRGALLVASYTPLYVAPQIWQAHHGCLSGGDKNVTKAKALSLFPSTKITHANADALLIAAYARDWWARPRGAAPPA